MVSKQKEESSKKEARHNGPSTTVGDAQRTRGRAHDHTFAGRFLHKATCTYISPSKNRNLSKILLIADECVPTAVAYGSHSA